MGVKKLFPCLLLLVVVLVASCSSYERQVVRQLDQFEKVTAGQPSGRVIIPVNQVLTPLGIQVELPRMRPQAIALSPDGKLLATSGKTSELILVNPETGDILQRIPLPSEAATNALPGVSTHILKPDEEGQLSFTGLIFSKDGKRIYLSNVDGSIKIFAFVFRYAYRLPGLIFDQPADINDLPDMITVMIQLAYNCIYHRHRLATNRNGLRHIARLQAFKCIKQALPTFIPGV